MTRVGMFTALLAVTLGAESQEPQVQVSGGITAVALYPDDSRIEAGRSVSADLYLQRPFLNGQWLAYIEGNSNLDPGGASTLLIEANADAGSALDPDRDGRIQLSELYYQFSHADGDRLTAGLLDPSSYLDRTRITNDENVQFLGASFVNNPTIAFPDYTLGAVYEKPGSGRRPQLNAVLTSSNGLADNPNLSYSQLIRLRGDDDGAFAALGLGWVSERRLVRVGAWVNTRTHLILAGDGRTMENYGTYLVFGQSWADHAMSLRLGLANEKVSEGSEFAALAYRYRWRDHAIGVGLARTFLSDSIRDPELSDSTHLEVFGRFTINGSIHLTASVQHLRHSGFVAAESDARNSVMVGGMRLHYAF